MQKETCILLQKTIPELVCIIFTSVLLISLFSLSASAEDVSSTASITGTAKISTVLSSKIAESSEAEKIPVIIVLPDQQNKFNTADGKSQIASGQKALIKFLESEKSNNKVEKIKSIKIVNAVAARATPEVLASLAERSDVWKIELDQVVSLVEQPESSSTKVKVSAATQNAASVNAWGVDKIEAPSVWQQGVNGNGIIVAVVDTGIDAQHPDLDDLDDNADTVDPKVIGWIDYVNSNSSPYDDHGHGTHVAGTISGTGANGIRTGVAPGTKLIGAKVLDAYGSGYLSDCMLAFEWAVNNNARIISFSAGGSHDWTFTTTINNVVAAGVIPVIAAGNSGPESYTILCPGDEKNSTTVGATDTSDTIAYFSSRGPVILDGQTYIKPDVSAPGVDVTSTLPGGLYEDWSGTSMATPHVSGTVALMLENNPSMKPWEIKQILQNTAVDLGPTGKDSDYGSGRINAYQAVFGSTDPVLPVADFGSNITEGYAPLAVQFTDLSEAATGRNWDFENDGIVDSTDGNPIYVYTTPGTYTVNLTAINENGMSSKLAEITVLELPIPVADFSAKPASGNAPLKVSFSDMSTGAPASWLWDFGDGSTSTDKNPTHTYSTAGKYTVGLTVENAVGSSTATKSDYISVTVKVPTADFSASATSGKAPLKVQFTDRSTGSPTSWRWTFGDGTYSTQQNPKHTYTKAGRYAVSLTVKCPAGSDTKNVPGCITVSKK
ncbi:S8 family serine peptidase [Methanosarcina sp.]|uniref:S8 family serine peptidase n=1 Tax=Methanosarcina sp. TaxID=2213 RepID=UPI003C747E1B